MPKADTNYLLVRIPYDGVLALLDWRRLEKGDEPTGPHLLALPCLREARLVDGGAAVAIPKDARVVNVDRDHKCRTLDLTLAHPSFPPHADGGFLPVALLTRHVFESVPAKEKDRQEPFCFPPPAAGPGGTP